MPVRQIIHHPAQVLRRKARKVTAFGPELQNIIDDMVENMREAPGVGLAAPQVDLPLRVIVVEYPEKEYVEDAPLKLYTVINPEITRFSDDSEVGPEGCLSIPGFAGDVEHLKELYKQALQHRGFSLLEVLQPCVSFNKINTFAWYRQRVYRVEETSDYPSFQRINRTSCLFFPRFIFILK